MFAPYPRLGVLLNRIISLWLGKSYRDTVTNNRSPQADACYNNIISSYLKPMVNRLTDYIALSLTA